MGDSRQCDYPGCTTRKTDAVLAQKSFHRLPNDPSMRRLWLLALKKDPATCTPEQTRNFIVCSDHFDDDAYSKRQQRSRLKSHAIPQTPASMVSLYMYNTFILDSAYTMDNKNLSFCFEWSPKHCVCNHSVTVVKYIR